MIGKGLFDTNGARGDLIILFSLEDFYLPYREPLYQLCHLPMPILSSDGVSLQSLPFWDEKQSQQPQPQSQNHFRPPHVQECRPS